MHRFIQLFIDRALDVMASGADAEPFLNEFASALQDALPGATVGLTVLNIPRRAFRRATFPRLPPSFSRSLENNIIDGKRGSCGLAILSGRIIEVPNVAEDERFSTEWKTLLKQHGLHSMISVPAHSPDNTAQGCIAIMYHGNETLTTEQLKLVRQAASLHAKVCMYSRNRESEKLLLGELDHRMSNLFLTFGGMASLTAKNYPDLSEFRRVISDRLHAMHHAHKLATAGGRIELSSLLLETLAPYSTDYEITISGPRLLLTPEAASALALVIHELGTNAAKYGAFSQQDGSVQISWTTISDEEQSAYFSLQWLERNGPTTKPPSRRGYGSTMISGSLRNAFDGAAVMKYEPLGFECTITAPMTERIGEIDDCT